MLKRESNYAPVGCLNHEPRATRHLARNHPTRTYDHVEKIDTQDKIPRETHYDYERRLKQKISFGLSYILKTQT